MNLIRRTRYRYNPIDKFREIWSEDGARQHEDILAAVRASAQEIVSWNITGHLDIPSRALADGIRHLHEEKH